MKQVKKYVTLAVFLLPVLVPLMVFWIWPTLNVAYVSITDWDYMTPDYKIVGLSKYIKLLSGRDFLEAAEHTLIFCFFSAIFTVGGGLTLALLLKKKFGGKSFFQVLFFSPWITPTVAISLVWLWIFDERGGVANAVLSFFSLPALKWIGSTDVAMISVIIVTVWKSVGYAMIFYINALDKVPQFLYEAASMDQASFWQKLRKITLPCISPTTFFLCVISTINGLQAYDQIQILTQGGPSGSTRTLLYLYYQMGFERYDMGLASALAVIILLLTILLSVIQNAISRRTVYY